MPMSLPPWLQPVNPVPYFTEGISQGTGIAERQNRAERAIQEMTMRREAQQRQNNLEALTVAHTIQQMGLAKQAADEKAREAALKWQGQQKYQSIIDAGGTPEEAFSASAHLLMPGQLWHIPAMAQSRANAEANRALREREVKVREAGLKLRQDKPPDIAPLKSQLIGVNSRIRQAEGKMAGNVTEEQKAAATSELEVLYDERSAIEDAIQEAGGQVAKTPRPTFTTAQEVSTPPDLRSPLRKILPNILGGASAPQPITNMVTRMTAPLGSRPPAIQTNLPPAVTDSTNAPPFEPPKTKGKLTEEKARYFLKLAQGNKALARKIAIDDGWEL